ncbi:MAG: hypothetical protein KDI14_15050 [Halioglobus sp.]|nr:hypothetical protein [Halioglobus sp.]
MAAVPDQPIDENPFHALEIKRSTGTKEKLVEGVCGGCGSNWEGRCGGMMMGGAMPPALGLAQLPEPDSAGAKLLTRFCTQCHNLPSPKQHSASGWSVTLARMNMRMQWMTRSQSAMNVAAPSEDELNTITGYLVKHASAESQ